MCQRCGARISHQSNYCPYRYATTDYGGVNSRVGESKKERESRQALRKQWKIVFGGLLCIVGLVLVLRVMPNHLLDLFLSTIFPLIDILFVYFLYLSLRVFVAERRHTSFGFGGWLVKDAPIDDPYHTQQKKKRRPKTKSKN